MDWAPSGPVTATTIATATALSVANIDDPSAELSLLAGTISGETRLCYQTVVGANEWTLYAWDSSSTAGASTGYRVNGSSGQWIAVAGKYENGSRNFHDSISCNGLASTANITITVGGLTGTFGGNSFQFTRSGAASFVDQNGISGSLTFRATTASAADTTAMSFSNTALSFSLVSTFSSGVTVTGPLTASTGATVVGALSVSGTSTHVAGGTFSSGLTVVGALAVSGTTTLVTTVNASSGANVAGAFAVSGATTLTSLLTCSTGITSSGNITFNGTSGATLALLSGTTSSGVATTFTGTGPTGSTPGAPQGWMRILVAGTPRFIPFW